MKENICTIPIDDIFSEKNGCPLCRIYESLERQYVKFIVGDAMMEPSIRVDVNKQGFCGRHFEQLVQVGSRLPIALMLETHLEYLAENGINPSTDRKQAEVAEQLLDDCFICRRIDKSFSLYIDTILEHWQKEAEFRQLFAEQPYICARHTAMLVKRSGRGFHRFKDRKQFQRMVTKMSAQYLDTLRADIQHFCEMYDYRRREQDWGNSLDSIERSISYLTSHNVEKDK